MDYILDNLAILTTGVFHLSVVMCGAGNRDSFYFTDLLQSSHHRYAAHPGATTRRGSGMDTPPYSEL